MEAESAPLVENSVSKPSVSAPAVVEAADSTQDNDSDGIRLMEPEETENYLQYSQIFQTAHSNRSLHVKPFELAESDEEEVQGEEPTADTTDVAEFPQYSVDTDEPQTPVQASITTDQPPHVDPQSVPAPTPAPTDPALSTVHTEPTPEELSEPVLQLSTSDDGENEVAVDSHQLGEESAAHQVPEFELSDTSLTEQIAVTVEQIPSVHTRSSTVSGEGDAKRTYRSESLTKEHSVITKTNMDLDTEGEEGEVNGAGDRVPADTHDMETGDTQDNVHRGDTTPEIILTKQASDNKDSLEDSSIVCDNNELETPQTGDVVIEMEPSQLPGEEPSPPEPVPMTAVPTETASAGGELDITVGGSRRSTRTRTTQSKTEEVKTPTRRTPTRKTRTTSESSTTPAIQSESSTTPAIQSESSMAPAIQSESSMAPAIQSESSFGTSHTVRGAYHTRT